MKKSLARPKPIAQKKLQHKLSSDIDKKTLQIQKQITFRNLSLKIVPQNLKKIIDKLIVLDVSHNSLDNTQIDYIFNNGRNIEYLHIQDNQTTLIPSSIHLLKKLKHFRHDWVKLFKLPQQSNLSTLQIFSRKPDLIVRLQSVDGISFVTYCKHILKIELNQNLYKKIGSSSCSPFAKESMIKFIDISLNKKQKQQVKIVNKPQNFMMQHYPGCMMLMGFQQKQKAIYTKANESFNDNDENSSQNKSTKGRNSMKINQIKNLDSSSILFDKDQATSDENNSYYQPELPLHNIFAKFNQNTNSEMQVRKLFTQKINPNLLDSRGLSIFHLCVINNQIAGLKFLLDVNCDNPNFLDLTINTITDCRNIAHYCIFLKNMHMLQLLIQYEYPLNYRDKNGARAIHLIDQNIYFLMKLRKILKKNKKGKNTMNRYQKRMKKQSKFITIENRNQNLLDQYEQSVGINRN